MSGENANKYRVEYGAYDSQTDTFVDTLLDGYVAGNVSDRLSDDTSIYNTGTVTNVLTDTTNVQVRKTWIADAFQSELDDVSVSFRLESRPENSDEEWATVPDVSFIMGNTADDGTGKPGVPFTAENMMQIHSTNLPVYDNEGNRLEYRWVEDKIHQGETEIKVTDGKFTLSQKGENVEYTSTSTYDEENRLTDIVNEIVDETQYNVEKNWNEEEWLAYIEEEGSNLTPEQIEAIKNKTWWPVALQIYRSDSFHENYQLYLKNDAGDVDEALNYKLDGSVDPEPTLLYVRNSAFDSSIPESEDNQEYIFAGQVQEITPWHAEFTKLALYDEGGSVYDYIVVEAIGQEANWSADYSVRVDNGITTFVITNVPPGTSDRIYVRKRWMDDGDEQHRGAVTMTAYRVPDTYDQTDENAQFSLDQLEELGNFTLSRENNWWGWITLVGRISVETPAIPRDKLIVLETSIAGTQEGEVAHDLTGYYTPEVLRAVYKDQHAEVNDEQNAFFQYQTANHQYEATFSMQELQDIEFYTATNRRLGRVDITVTKNWLDGQNTEIRNEFINALGNDYELVLQLKAADIQDVDVSIPGNFINYDNNTVQLVNSVNQISQPVDKNNPDSNVLENALAIQTINVNDASSKYYFWNLPKYNEYGKIVRYTVIEGVREKGTNNVVPVAEFVRNHKIQTEYTFTMVQDRYVPSLKLQPDQQEMTATNRLSGTKNVFFWKEWNDAYRFKKGQRPDYYLSLYRWERNNETGEYEMHYMYRDLSLKFYDDKYITFCDFGNLDKYDANGYEYIYYAKENVKIEDKVQFDYLDVEYKYDSQFEDRDFSNEPDSTIVAALEELESIGGEQGYTDGAQETGDLVRPVITTIEKNPDGSETTSQIYGLKECGIFVNTIGANVHVSGKKVWYTMPDGFQEEDLVPVTFYLFQYYEDSTNKPSDSDTMKFDEETPYFEDSNGNKHYAISWINIDEWKTQKVTSEYVFALEYAGENINPRIEDGSRLQVDKDGKVIVSTPDGSTDASYLPKYDKDGNLYEYILRESGDFSSSDVGQDGTNLIFKQPTINNYAITNEYDSVDGSVTVKKFLDVPETYEGNSSVVFSFKLTRQYGRTEDKTKLVNDDKFEQVKKITFDQFESGIGTVTFDNLELYAPNGNRYVYTVTENPSSDELIQGGFIVKAQNGIADTADAVTGKPIINEDGLYSVTNIYPKQNDAPVGIIESLIDSLASIPEMLGLTPRQQEEDRSGVTFKNTYQEMFAPLQFAKEWDDSGLSDARFNTPLTFQVSRSADSQPGQNNPIGNESLGSFTIYLTDEAKKVSSVTLTKGINETQQCFMLSNVNQLSHLSEITISVPDGTTLATNADWTVKINEFSTYAFNGMPWKYTLREDDVYPYITKGNNITFTYNEADNTFNGPENSKFVNSTKVNVRAVKDIRPANDNNTDYLAGNTSLWNYTGFNIQLKFEVYAKFVQADSWEAAKEEFLKEDRWSSLADPTEDNPYKAAVRTAMNKPDETFTTSIGYENNSSFGKKEASISNLPRIIEVNGKAVYVSYALLETELNMTDPSVEGTPVIYKQTFEPHPVVATIPDTRSGYNNFPTTYKKDEKVLSYYMTTTSVIRNGSEFVDAEGYNFLKPLFDEEQDARLTSDTVKNFDFRSNEDLLPIIWVDRYDNNNPANNTFTNEQVNLLDTLDLSVTKNWKNDFNNYWGTRPVDTENSANWKVDYQLQQSINGTEWVNFNIEEYGYEIIVNGQSLGTVNKYQDLTGLLDTDAYDTVAYTNLPAGGILKITDGSETKYDVAKKFSYRVLEKNTDQVATLLNSGDRFNNAYEVTYETDEKDSNHLIINNEMQTTERYAKKRWADPNLTGTVKFELQYLSETGKWTSFALHIKDSDKSATVTLDGIDDKPTDEKFYESPSWEANWIDLPDQMPGSKLEDGVTKYRVVEVIVDNNAYGLGEDNTELEGKGTEESPYVLTDGFGKIDDPFTVTNEFTRMRVSKTVTKPANGEINPAITGKIFTFTIEPEKDKIIPNSAKYQIYQKNGGNSPTLISDYQPLLKDPDTGVATFTLKDNQYAEIYGLQKGVEYTVTETPVQDEGDDSLDYKVTYELKEVQLVEGETEGTKEWEEKTTNTNSVKLPVDRQDGSKNPIHEIAVTNERLGKVTITKTNLDGTIVLKGMTFKLEVQNGVDSNKNPIWETAKTWDPNAKWNDTTEKWVDYPEVTSGEDGIAIFKNLELDKHYKLTETVAPGYHKYPFSIEFDLPYKPTANDKPNEDAESGYYYSITDAEGTSYFYPEIEMTIENDQAFIMPQTSGTGFFWPGMIGVAVSVLSAGGYVVTRKKKKKEDEETEEVN